MRHRLIAPAALLCLLTAGCGEGFDFSTPKPATDPQRESVQGNKSPLTVAVLAGERPNSYFVRLGWPKATLTDSSWSLRKLRHGDKTVGILAVESLKDKTEFDDRDVQPGATYSYMLYHEGDTKELVEQKVTLPRDLVVQGMQVFDAHDGEIKISGIKRLFLNADGFINSLGNDLTIDVEEIVADKSASIRTFATGSEALLGNEGRAGGKVSIKASKLTGTLAIHLRGEKGGQGFKGARGGIGGEGPRGPTKNRLELMNYGVCRPATEESARRSGAWERHPARGGKGGRGGMGLSGYPGIRGGDSGSLDINIAELKENQLSIVVEPGLGGRGGEPGDGGPGGQGGPGGGILDNRVCDEGRSDCCFPAPRGETGDIGPRGTELGPEGPRGKPGSIQVNGEKLSVVCSEASCVVK